MDRSVVNRDVIHAVLGAVQDDVEILRVAQVDAEKLDLPFAMAGSVAKACRYVSTLIDAHFVISGHTDTIGSDTDNGGFA